MVLQFSLSFILFLSLITFSDQFDINAGTLLNNGKFTRHLEQIFHGPSYGEKDAICCAKGQWEATAYVYANTLLTLHNITMPMYYNGTAKIAFDELNMKSYIKIDVTEFIAGEPDRFKKTSTTIKDFAKGVTYSIYEGNCFKPPGSPDIKIVCIPGDAMKISDGDFGGADVTTYQFSHKDTLDIITTASVLQNGTDCETVMLSYAMVAEGSPEQFVYNINVVDISRGIKDPSVFVPPKYCN